MMPGRSLFSKTSGRSWAPGGQDDLAGTDVPDPLAGDAGAAGLGQVVGAVLDGDDVVGVVGAERGGAVQHGALRRAETSSASTSATQSRAGLPSMVSARPGRWTGQQRAAEFGLVVHQDDAGAGADGFAGRGQAGGAAADHQHVGVDVLLVVLGPSSRGSSLPRPLSSSALRPSTRDTVVAGSMDSATWPGKRARDLDQGVGFLDAGGHDAAGAVLVERVAGG